MAKCCGSRKWACFILLAFCIAITVSAIVLGVLSLVEVRNGEPTNAWYLVGAASAAILLLPFVATPLSWVAVELFIRQTRASDAADIELQYREGSNPSPSVVSTVDTTDRISPTARLIPNNSETAANKEFQSSQDVPPEVDAAEVVERRPTAVLKTGEDRFPEAEIYDVRLHRIDQSKFQSLNMAACAMLCIALMCFSLSFMFLMWSIFIGVRYNKQQDYFWHSMLFKIVLNILCPAFGIVGLFLVLNVVTYISAGQIDCRVLYSFMLASAKIVNAELVHPPKLTFKLWVIGDLFYLRLRTPRGNPKHLSYYIDRTPATYFLAAFVCLAFTVAAWLCLEAMLWESVTVTTPVTEDDCSGYTCLHRWTPVSCSEAVHLNITDNTMLFCVLFRVEVNIYHSSNKLIAAVILYIAAVQLLKWIATIIAFLLLIYQTRIWGVVLLIGLILLFIAILVIVIETDSIDLTTKAKLVAIPILFIPMNFLLLSGGIKHAIQEPQRTRCIIVKSKQYFEGVRHMNTLTDAPSPQSKV